MRFLRRGVAEETASYETRMLKLLKKALEERKCAPRQKLESGVDGNDVRDILKGVSIAIWHWDTNWIICDTTACSTGRRAKRQKTGQLLNALKSYWGNWELRHANPWEQIE